jgi:hypothetical protein
VAGAYQGSGGERQIPPSETGPTAHWVGLVAFWRANIGPLEEFWALSPRETEAIIEAFLEREDIQNQRHGTTAATTWNANRDSKKQKWHTWKDYFNPLAQRNKRKRGLTLDEMRKQALQMRRDVYGR